MARRSKITDRRAASALILLVVAGLVTETVVQIRHNDYHTASKYIAWACIAFALVLGFILPVRCKAQTTRSTPCGNYAYGLLFGCTKSTAIGVVRPQQAGMASGINSTFRQVGIATGIALLGTLFSSKVSGEVQAKAAAVPALAHKGPKLAAAVQSGEIGRVIAKLPPHLRHTVGLITRSAFTAGLNHILLVAAVIVLASGVVALVAIRRKDFAQQH